ncbi:hypothetical protein ACFLZZ_02085 [Nanoarchaeota archaeon]
MKRKIVLIDGMPTTGKSTTSYNLAKSLPGWVFIDIWRIKDIFEPIGYSKKLDKKEKQALMELSKKTVVDLVKGVIKGTKRKIILQEATVEFVKEKLGKDLKKNGYKIYTVQLTVPFKQAIKRNRKRGKPILNFLKGWDEKKWKDKIKSKIKRGDLVADTFKNNPKRVVEIILKGIGEKSKKHPYADKIRKFW